MTKIKLCGLTRISEVEAANELRPEYVGFVFAKGSRRAVSAETAALLKNEVNCAAVILYPKPVAHIESCAVKRNGIVSKTFADDRWNKFLSMLPRTVIVATMRDGGIHAEGFDIGAHQQIGRSLACRVRACGSIGRVLGKKAFCTKSAEHFVG